MGLQIMEEVTPGTEEGPIKHYIPHHVVKTPGKATTKLRVVYDASAKTRKDARSLNECLYSGPNMLPDLVGMLLRFRLPEIAMVSDIEKAFLQVGIKGPDRDLLRSLWVKDINNPELGGNLMILRFCRVPFGVISSPFLLEATVKHHLKKADTEVAEDISKNIYVDNAVGGEQFCRKGF